MFSRLGEVGCLSKEILVPLAPDSRAVRTTNGIVHNLDRNTERSYRFFPVQSPSLPLPAAQNKRKFAKHGVSARSNLSPLPPSVFVSHQRRDR